MVNRMSIDVSQVLEGLDTLASIRTSLARSMAVAGGTLMRDGAKARASVRSGKLRDAIYLAYRDKESTADRAVYRVSWNAKKAPHGHLIEFGHWRYNKFINGAPQRSLKNGRRRGRGPQDHEGPGALDTPVFEPAHPFLRPTLEANRATVQKVMIDRGRVRLPQLLAGGKVDES